MDSISKPIRRIETNDVIRPSAQIMAAVLLALPTTLAGHTLGFMMAQIGGSTPLSWFMYPMGEGVAASIFFAIFLLRFRASFSSRFWCWSAIAALLVLAFPSMSVISLQYANSESIHAALICIQFVMAFLLWLAWLPWWRPTWIKPGATVFRPCHRFRRSTA